jgi:lysophospholipase L1-like esterase
MIQQTKKNNVIGCILCLLLIFTVSNALTAHADIIIDNGQSGTSYTGAWGVSGGSLPYGANSLWARDGVTYTWQFSSQPAGTYDVYMWWSGYTTRATNIAVDIYHRDGKSTVYVNQQLNAGQWNKLGQYYFDSSGRVTIIAANGSTVSTCADAVRFAPVSTNPPPVAYIDSIIPNPALPGEPVEFTGHGTDDGSVTEYEWTSSINGILSNQSSFSTSSLTAGIHTISFRVRDDEDVWSVPATQNLTVGIPTVETIIDNGTSGTSFTGTWWVSGATDPYGANSLWSRDGTTYTWSFTPAVSGNYAFSMWWTTWPSRSTRVPVNITHAGGTSTIYIDQQLNGGKWNLLETFPFLAGQSYTVKITSQPGPSSTCADAVKFFRVSDINSPPVASIDSITPDPALPGETVTFTGSGSDSDGTITGYSWRSSIDGSLSNAASFDTASLSEGIHNIYFKVKDDKESWSSEVSRIIGHLGCEYPVRIMPLGDSITHGTYGANDSRTQELITGYREPLYQSLIGGNYYVDFAGSLQNGQSFIPLFDFDHEGHGAYRDDQVASGIYQWLTENHADIILLHIGTNELDSNPADVENILKEIDRYSGNTTVILARIINRMTYSATTTQFNNNIEAMARNRIAGGDKIIIADQENALSYPSDMNDLLHPNSAGYEKMANVWLDALTGILPVCPQASMSLISAISGPGGSISPSGAVTVSDGQDYTFAITPNAGYHIEDVLVDGQSEGAITLYTFFDVASDHTIEATFALDAPMQETIIDNRSASTSYTGTWSVSGATGFYGTDSVWSRDGATFTWRFSPLATGVHNLHMWWTIWPSRSTNIPVDITHAGGTSRVYINQQENGSQWNLLGAYTFEAGKNYTVKITSQPGPSSTCADAVKFVYVSGGNLPPTATIDSILPNPALPGETVTLTGSGSDSDGTVTGYNWRSSIDGQLSSAASFSTSSLSGGNHTIYFRVQDDKEAWSQEVVKIISITDQTMNTEHIYIGIMFNAKKAEFVSVLQNIGAQQVGDVWTYTNATQGKTYVIHLVEDLETMKQALYTENAHIIMTAHSNYGLGGIFATEQETQTNTINDIYYVDDPRIWNYSSPWIGVSIKGMIHSQKYPNWWPLFEDGTNPIMPYDFTDPLRDPPYNYYHTYQVPGDPTLYKVEPVHNSARESFPASYRPAWFSPDGSPPDPDNPDHRQYYITNTNNDFESIGKWLWYDAKPGYYGVQYCYIKAGLGTSQTVWHFSIPTSGNYNVYAWWPAASSNTSQASYTVNHAGGSTTIIKNQQINGSTWNVLGTFYFSAGDYSVVLSDSAASGEVIADAIRVTNSSNPSFYSTIIDNSYCPKEHYDNKTIVFRKNLEVDIDKLKYYRMLFDACSTATYYLDTFHRGLMFMTVVSSNGNGTFKYLQEYLAGKSDEEIWASMQAVQPVYDYYDFTKRPSEQ